MTKRSIQMMISTRRQIGRAIMNDEIHDTLGFMFHMAITFCGDEIGLAIPPTFAASAIPIINAFAYGDRCGRFLRIG
jgi:hypothetical protein